MPTVTQEQAREIFEVVKMADKAQEEFKSDHITFGIAQSLIKAWNDKSINEIVNSLKYLEINLKGRVKHRASEEVNELYIKAGKLRSKLEGLIFNS